MPTELAKTYDPSAVESTAYKTWLDEGAFTANPAAPGTPYCIVIPPPNVTGALHLGHAINNTLQDILTRYHRMRGFNTLWVPGIDHAGIATQAVVEKQLKEKENKTRHDVGREGLVERIWAWKEQYGNRILDQLKRLGSSCDWTRTRFTLDEMCACAVRHTFFKLFKDGLIYRGKRLVNWDIHLQTSISDDEIYHETVKTSLWHIKYPISSTGYQPVSSESHGQVARATHMTVATTRPETMLGDTAVAVHSQDPRWNWAIGQSVELPLTGRKIPIIADDILVDPKFGSGVVKVTPAHDPNDYAVYQRHLGQPDRIDIINILTPDGRINENGGPYAGMKRDAARAKVVADLEAQGLLAKIEPYETQVGHSDRSKTPVEPYLSDQWFVKMAPLAEPALEVVRNGTIKFFPERHAQQYLSWLGEKRDWPISRQLWWGHRIPVWTKTLRVGDRQSLKSLFAITRTSEGERWEIRPELREHIVLRIHTTAQTSFVSNDDIETVFACVAPGRPEIERELELLGFVQDPDVLDTWFSSALWPHSTLGWPQDTPDLRTYYPTAVLVTSRDIITLWVARMVMTGIYNMTPDPAYTPKPPPDQVGPSPTPGAERSEAPDASASRTPAIPFHHVYIHPTILDGKGERMSKSKGNGVDPVDIIETHGADALRFTLTTMATETQDARLPVKKLPDGRNTSEKFDLGRNFCNKLWNACRFAFSNLESIPAEPAEESQWTIPDRWVLSRLMRTIKECDDALAAYRFDQYAKTAYDFFWRDLCDWYIEAIKPDLKETSPRRGQAANVLAAALDHSLRLLHPIIPFITETIWWKFNEIRPDRSLGTVIAAGGSPRLIRAQWPQYNDSITSEGAEHVFTKLQDLITAIRNIRTEYKVDPKKTLAVTILAPGDSARQIQANKPLIELLATAEIRHASAEAAPPANSARATAAGCEIYAEGLIDPAAEQQRQQKRCEDLKKQRDALAGRLNNPGYSAKAPPHLVQQTKQQLAEVEAELTKLGCG